MLLPYAAVEALVNERIESLDGSVRVKRPMRVASKPNWARLRWLTSEQRREAGHCETARDR
jgi:hypothetical protein